nr:MAG TPA: hypothetical protein [Caudoviricetes sp.]DAO53555.1 MAG TPA: hypothetical protein [Caudoviricetes sp.]
MLKRSPSISLVISSSSGQVTFNFAAQSITALTV